MDSNQLDPRLKVLQQADLKDKVVLLRVDHNVVKKGKVIDPYRIEATLGTIYAIAEKGGRPILMTHIGRPKDKKTGKIVCKEDESVGPIVKYLEQKLPLKIRVPELPIDPEAGILHLDQSLQPALQELKNRKISMIYLPNTRWFQGEESKGPERALFAKELGAIADIYINDAFGSWQAHASTYDIASQVPSYAGHLLQKEILNCQRVLEPERPFVAVVAGAKYDTKIGPLKILFEKADHLILGGLIYNTFLAAKYGVEIAGVTEEEKALAADLVSLDAKGKKIVETPWLLESQTDQAKVAGKCRTVPIKELKPGQKLAFVLDADPKSFEDPKVKEVIGAAKTIFINAVMGLMPYFGDGSRAFYNLVAANKTSLKLFGGGDTLQELKNLCPGVYMAGVDDPRTYYFTGGGSVLTAIEEGSPYKIKPVEVLLG
jgi:phosphoglycerate kinase